MRRRAPPEENIALIDVDASSPFFEALLPPYLVALKVINLF